MKQLVYEQRCKNSCNPFKLARIHPFVTEQPLESSIFKAITVDNGSKLANLAEALPTLPAYLYGSAKYFSQNGLQALI